MREHEKRAIYNILAREFAAGEAQPLSKVGIYLTDSGVQASTYGFKKMKQLFQELGDYLVMYDVTIGKHIHPYIKLRPVDQLPGEGEQELAWEKNDLEEAAAETAAAQEENVPAGLEPVEEIVDTEEETDSAVIVAEESAEGHSEEPVAEDASEESLDARNEWAGDEAADEPNAEVEETAVDSMELEADSAEQDADSAEAKSNPAESEEPSLPDWIAKPRWVVLPKAEEKPAKKEEEPAVEADPNDPYPELPKTMEEGIYLAPKTLGKLNYYLKGVEEQPDEEVIKALCQAFNAARVEGRLLRREDSFRFRLNLTALNGDEMVASIKLSSYNGTNPNAHKWYLNFAGTQKAPGQPGKISPGKTLEQFAFLGSWANFLENLAARALKEPWDFSEGEEKKYDILQKYIQYTFYRLQLEDKICIDETDGFAAFNTGLVNVHYDDIFACFELSDGDHETRWKFVDFCTAAGRGLGKRLVESFNPLPQTPQYFERKEDLFYDLQKELHCDFDHIIVDNISRFPLGFLKEECHDFPEAMEILREISDEMDYTEKKNGLKDLSDLIEATPRLFNRLRHRIEDAISLAKKQVRWNFKTAVPCYFPTRNVMSLMLPLDLEEDGITDAALVVELTRSGNYQGQTVLTLQQAYLDARLLCRPNNEWLTPQNIPTAEELEED